MNLLHSLAKNSESPAAAEFVKMVDRKIYEQTKKLAEEIFVGDPEGLAMVEKATTTEELWTLIHKVAQEDALPESPLENIG